MTTRKDVPASEDARKVAFMATTNQAQAARVLGQPEKPFRDVSRGKFGIYVSHDDGGTWDARNKEYRYAYAITSGDARKAVLASFKAGDALPPVTE